MVRKNPSRSAIGAPTAKKGGNERSERIKLRSRGRSIRKAAEYSGHRQRKKKTPRVPSELRTTGQNTFQQIAGGGGSYRSCASEKSKRKGRGPALEKRVSETGPRQGGRERAEKG